MIVEWLYTEEDAISGFNIYDNDVLVTNVGSSIRNYDFGVDYNINDALISIKAVRASDGVESYNENKITTSKFNYVGLLYGLSSDAYYISVQEGICFYVTGQYIYIVSLGVDKVVSRINLSSLGIIPKGTFGGIVDGKYSGDGYANDMLRSTVISSEVLYYSDVSLGKLFVFTQDQTTRKYSLTSEFLYSDYTELNSFVRLGDRSVAINGDIVLSGNTTASKVVLVYVTYDGVSNIVNTDISVDINVVTTVTNGFDSAVTYSFGAMSNLYSYGLFVVVFVTVNGDDGSSVDVMFSVAYNDQSTVGIIAKTTNTTSGLYAKYASTQVVVVNGYSTVEFMSVVDGTGVATKVTDDFVVPNSEKVLDLVVFNDGVLIITEDSLYIFNGTSVNFLRYSNNNSSLVYTVGDESITINRITKTDYSNNSLISL